MYLQQHNIPRILEDAIAKLVQSRPHDPFTFLADQLKAHAAAHPTLHHAHSTAAPTPRVVFVLGGPGAGKGTQCANIVRDFGWVHLSAGDLLREARSSGDETGQMIDRHIKEGQIVPVKVTVQLIKRAMELSVKQGKTDFLVDGPQLLPPLPLASAAAVDCRLMLSSPYLWLCAGFPRNADNLEGWYNEMGSFCSVEFVLFFDCPEAVMEERLMKRGQTSGRADDNPDSIRKRFRTYLDSTMPVIQHFAQQGKVRQVSAVDSVDAVYKQVQVIFSALPPPSATSSAAAKPKVVFVLGGPGAGKGTQCANIVRDFGWVHLSAGDLLREARSSGDETGQMIDRHIKEGQIVPVKVTVQLIKKAIEVSLEKGQRLFLVDGFPRNADNLEGWYNEMGSFCSVEFVLFFDCPEAVMEERLMKRGQTSGRADDNPDSIRKRFHTYLESTLPIIDRFAKEGKVQRVLATSSIDEVYAEVKRIFSQHSF